MKKIILFLAAITLLATSCGEKDAFTIKGKLPSAEYDGQTVYLQTLDSTWSRNPKTYVTIETANVLNGEFVFNGIAKEGPALHFIVLDNAPENMKAPVAVIVEPGQIKVTLDSVSTVEGTPLNSSYQSLMSDVSALSGEIEKVQSDTANHDKAALDKQLREKGNQQNQIIFDFVKANIQNQVGTYLFVTNSYRFDVEQTKELLASVKPELKGKLKKIEARIIPLENTAVGKTFTDINGKTPEGKEAALSEYAGKGKYVLVDFWASWCPDCRIETPTLVEAYNLYKDKGFEIVGFSLDKTNDNWVKGLKDLNITWPQISELNVWDSKPVADYGVSSIPHLVLLDKDGKIIARGLSAYEVAEKLGELLK
ncbi:MAG: AhpC/TSA family protein [Prevotella sp.]|jgi:thiol-disulfide isomerase/thioredoxin|nr:AhpC/TSA family protein [Prevotella sp.]